MIGYHQCESLCMIIIVFRHCNLLLHHYNSGEESVSSLITLKYHKEWIENNEKRCKKASEKKKVRQPIIA